MPQASDPQTQGQGSTQAQAQTPTAQPQQSLQAQLDALQQRWRAVDPDIVIQGSSTAIMRRGLVMFIWGHLGTRKTTLACLAPSPAVLSIGLEGGDKALGQLPYIWGIAPPLTYQIQSIAQFNKKIDFLLANGARLGIRSIVVDSVTSLIDMWLGELLDLRKSILSDDDKKRKAQSPLQEFQVQVEKPDWGRLENYVLRHMAGRLHNSGMNIIYTALAKDKLNQETGRLEEILPDIQGAVGRKLPALCDLILYASKSTMYDLQTQRVQESVTYWTTPPPGEKIFKVRHRFGTFFPEGKLVDPKYGSNVSFEAIMSRIGQFVIK